MFKQKFAIKTLNTILIGQFPRVPPTATQEDKIIALGILRDNGYIIKPSELQKFLSTDLSVNTLKDVFEAVKNIRGGDVSHATLIGKFPIKDPDQLSRSWLAFINHLSGIFDQIPSMLENRKELYQLEEKGNVIELSLSESIDEEIKTLFKTKVPLSLDHEEFVAELYKSNSLILSEINPEEIILKEILARHIAYELQYSNTETVSARSAIDLLRAVALISGEPNAKLDEQFKIKSLSNIIRRKIIATLDKVATIDDLTSKKGLFKKLLKILHVHESKNEKFKNIRALAKELQTINNPRTSRTELHKLVAGVGTKENFDLILGNPSLFIRNLDAILRKHDSKSVLELFEQSLKTRDVETKLLVQILEHFRNRDVDLTKRMFKPKGKATPIVVDKSLEALEQSVIEDLEQIIKAELKRQYSNKDTYIKKAYIDPELYKINVPRGLSDQDGMKVLSRGSRYKLKAQGDFLRLFVHWKDRTDIDLSATVLTKDFDEIDTVYYCHLSGNYFEHSGDVRSAPDGGSEFIDFDLKNMPKKARYIAMIINDYSGKEFDSIPELFAGFMIREDNLAGKVYEPKTVHDKFSISGGTEIKLCVLYDVETREIIMVNSSLPGGRCYNVHNANFMDLMNKILHYKYVTVGELIELNTEYVLCEDEQLTLTQKELDEIEIFDSEFGTNVLDITTRLL